MTRACDRKELAKQAVLKKQASIRLACATFGISETCYRYERRLSEENEEIAAWLHYLTRKHKRWGFALCFFHLRNVQGFGWNHKRVYRIYKQEGLHLRVKPRHRVKREKPEKLSVPDCPNEVLSGDFTTDQMSDGRKIRILCVVDDATRECVCMEVAFSFPARRVVQALERLIAWRGKPKSIRFDNGPEFVSREVRAWAAAHGIELKYIQPGNPQQNAYVERFNRTVRQEYLEMNDFATLGDAQHLATEWLWMYNHERPNLAIGGITPAMKYKEAMSKKNFCSNPR